MAAKTSRKLRNQAERALEDGRPCFRYKMNPGKLNEASFYVFTVPVEDGGFHYFASSREVRGLRHWADVYRSSWGIDTRYRVKRGLLARSAMRCMYVRLFLFLLSVLLQDSWELMDGVVASRLISSGTAVSALF